MKILLGGKYADKRTGRLGVVYSITRKYVWLRNDERQWRAMRKDLMTCGAYAAWSKRTCLT